jgi:2-octaprenyl-6-methoxyphenol hydroxylase
MGSARGGARCTAPPPPETDRQAYAQTALTFNLSHSRPHGHSTEFHRNRSLHARAARDSARAWSSWLIRGSARSCCTFRDCVAQKSGGVDLGKIGSSRPLWNFPLAVGRGKTLRRTTARRARERGGPPRAAVGAQSLISGCDAATVGELVAAHRTGRDIGAAADRALDHRRADVMSRTLAVDLLNRSLPDSCRCRLRAD